MLGCDKDDLLRVNHGDSLLGQPAVVIPALYRRVKSLVSVFVGVLEQLLRAFRGCNILIGGSSADRVPASAASNRSDRGQRLRRN